MYALTVTLFNFLFYKFVLERIVEGAAVGSGASASRGRRGAVGRSCSRVGRQAARGGDANGRARGGSLAAGTRGAAANAGQLAHHCRAAAQRVHPGGRARTPDPVLLRI